MPGSSATALVLVRWPDGAMNPSDQAKPGHRCTPATPLQAMTAYMPYCRDDSEINVMHDSMCLLCCASAVLTEVDDSVRRAHSDVNNAASQGPGPSNPTS